jgi:hypothetical protein
MHDCLCQRHHLCSLNDGNELKFNLMGTFLRALLVQVLIADGGWRHSVAATAGALYVWGWNKFGQLGIGETDDVCVPMKLAALSGPGTQIKHLACGWKHTLAVTTKGDFYAMGRGTNGQLGVDVSSDVYAPAPSTLSRPVYYMRVDYLQPLMLDTHSLSHLRNAPPFLPYIAAVPPVSLLCYVDPMPALLFDCAHCHLHMPATEQQAPVVLRLA